MQESGLKCWFNGLVLNGVSLSPASSNILLFVICGLNGERILQLMDYINFFLFSPLFDFEKTQQIFELLILLIFLNFCW